MFVCSLEIIRGAGREGKGREELKASLEGSDVQTRGTYIVAIGYVDLSSYLLFAVYCLDVYYIFTVDV